MAVTIIFAVLALIAVFSAILVITARNPVKAVLSLIVCFVATAGIWMLLQAEFLSLVLIVVYVGAVMVLFLFVVMMLDVTRTEEKVSFVKYWPVVGLLGVAFYSMLINLIGHMQLAPATQTWDFNQSNVMQVGQNLFSTALYPLEIAAVILLVAMIAAIALTFRGRNSLTRAQRVSEQVKVKARDRLKMVDIPVVKPVSPVTEEKLTEDKPTEDKA